MITNGNRYLEDLLLDYGGEVDVILLDDARIKTVEVHHEDVFVPEAALWFKDKTTFVFIFLPLCGDRYGGAVLGGFSFSLGRRGSDLLPIGLIRRDVLESMELVQQNVLVTFSPSSIESFVPDQRLLTLLRR